MPKFRKKPVVIEAMQFTDESKNQVFNWVTCNHAAGFEPGDKNRPILLIQTLEGTMEARVGDWVIKGVEGEFYPCKNHIFQATYEALEPRPDEESECECKPCSRCGGESVQGTDWCDLCRNSGIDNGDCGMHPNPVEPKPDSEVKSKWQAMTTPHRFQSICISSRCVECDLPEQDTIHLVHPVDGETDDICGGGEWRPIATAPIGKRILIATPLADQSVYVLEASFCDGSWRAWRDWSTVCDPTHWMPMPDPPQKSQASPIPEPTSKALDGGCVKCGIYHPATKLNGCDFQGSQDREPEQKAE